MLFMFSCCLLRFKSIIYMTLELQLFASLADYAGDVWEIVTFLLVMSRVKLELLKYYKTFAAEVFCKAFLHNYLMFIRHSQLN